VLGCGILSTLGDADNLGLLAFGGVIEVACVAGPALPVGAAFGGLIGVTVAARMSTGLLRFSSVLFLLPSFSSDCISNMSTTFAAVVAASVALFTNFGLTFDFTCFSSFKFCSTNSVNEDVPAARVGPLFSLLAIS